MACLPRPVMIRIWSHPEAMASSTPYWMMGLSTSGSISLGWALVTGRKRVPRPAAGNTALRTGGTPIPENVSRGPVREGPGRDRGIWGAGDRQGVSDQPCRRPGNLRYARHDRLDGVVEPP